MICDLQKNPIKAKKTQCIVLQFVVFLALMVLEFVMECNEVNEMFCFLTEKA